MRLASATFGRRLEAIRADRHLTQEELGTAVGKSKRTISHWETQPWFEVRERDAKECAKVLRCRLRDLLAPLDAPLPPKRRPPLRPILAPPTRHRCGANSSDRRSFRTA